MKDIPIMSVDLGIIENGCYHTMDVDQLILTINVFVPLWRALSCSGL
jgi:hypothetical protein